MLRKLQALVCFMCMLSYAQAGTVSIGTISAGGDMRVDGYAVKGNATLFDGSTVETGQAAAKLRVNKGVELVLSTDSRGTLYRDHLVLQKGQSEIRSSMPFQLETNGLRIVSNTPNSDGYVSTTPGDRVQVFSLSGEFQVATAEGAPLVTVRPGDTMVFTRSTYDQAAPSGGGGGGWFSSGWHWVLLGGGVAAAIAIPTYIHLHGKGAASR